MSIVQVIMEHILVFMMQLSMDRLLFNMIAVGHQMLFIQEIQLLSIQQLLGLMVTDIM